MSVTFTVHSDINSSYIVINANKSYWTFHKCSSLDELQHKIIEGGNINHRGDFLVFQERPYIFKITHLCNSKVYIECMTSISKIETVFAEILDINKTTVDFLNRFL